eukprot:3818386-Rhodomonas_salina.3
MDPTGHNRNRDIGPWREAARAPVAKVDRSEAARGGRLGVRGSMRGGRKGAGGRQEGRTGGVEEEELGTEEC